MISLLSCITYILFLMYELFTARIVVNEYTYYIDYAMCLTSRITLFQ